MTTENEQWLDFLSGHEFFFTGETCLSPRGVWIMAGLCSAMVGLSGLLPLIFMKAGGGGGGQTAEDQEEDERSQKNVVDENSNSTNNSQSGASSGGGLKFMLSFAVGSLLGDVFLHLLPEAFEKLYKDVRDIPDKEAALKALNEGQMFIGLWTIVGLLTFVAVEMVFSVEKATSSEREATVTSSENDTTVTSSEREGTVTSSDNQATVTSQTSSSSNISVSGYLNLVANCVDNFSHGLAVGAAFLVSAKVGLVTTVCILLHEIPHEIGDFAILLNSGFSRYEAAKAQFSTAALGMVGAFAALAMDSYVSVASLTAWIIPFTCGGFLNIALVSVLPDLLHSSDHYQCAKTLGGIVLGILTMSSLSSL